MSFPYMYKLLEYQFQLLSESNRNLINKIDEVKEKYGI